MTSVCVRFLFIQLFSLVIFTICVSDSISLEGLNRVADCLKIGRISPSYVSNSSLADLSEHYEFVMNKTSNYRQLPVHATSGYGGPWIENYFIKKFSHLPLAYFKGFVPLFIQWTDFDKLIKSKNDREKYGFAHLPFDSLEAEELIHHMFYKYNKYQDFYNILRKDVLYITVSQANDGLTGLSQRFPNILVLGAGGGGQVAIPLIKGEIPAINQTQIPPKRQSIAFFGSNDHGKSRKKALKDLRLHLPEYYNFTIKTCSNWAEGVAETMFNICPPGFGLGTFRLSEVIQIGRIPVLIHKLNEDWVPYEGTEMSVTQLGYQVEISHIKRFVEDISLELDIVLKKKLERVRVARHLYTYEGLMDQIIQFLKDPFVNGYLRCRTFRMTPGLHASVLDVNLRH